MRHARFPRLLALGGLIAASGCTHNYYYGNALPVCEAPPMISAPAVAYGQVCEVPTRVGGGTVVAADPGRAEPIIARRPPRQVVSEPASTRTASNGLGLRNGWRSRTDEGGATTTIVGAVPEDSTIR